MFYIFLFGWTPYLFLSIQILVGLRECFQQQYLKYLCKSTSGSISFHKATRRCSALIQREHSPIGWGSRRAGTPSIHLHGLTQQFIRDRVSAAGNKLGQGGPAATVGERWGLAGHSDVKRKTIIRHETPRAGEAGCQALIHFTIPEEGEMDETRRWKRFNPDWSAKWWYSSDSLLQFFLRMRKRAAGSTRTASLLLHVPTHVRLVLAVLRRLRGEVKCYEKISRRARPLCHQVCCQAERQTELNTTTILVVFQMKLKQVKSISKWMFDSMKSKNKTKRKLHRWL